MIQVLVLAIPMAVGWIIFSRQLTVPSLLVGYVFGVAILVIVRSNTTMLTGEYQNLHPSRLFRQLWAILRYSLELAIEIFVSGIDVAQRILPFTLQIKPSIYRIPVQDPSNSSVIAALSAHGITITPGSLVIDFEEEGGQTIMLVHVLDSQMWTEESQIEGQALRVKQLNEVLGR